MKNLMLFCGLSLCFFGCNSYVIQDIIGNPTVHLDKYDKFFIQSVEYKPDYIFSRLKKYLYSKQADIYKESKNSRIYVRNLGKIFVNVSVTTDLLIEISKVSDTKSKIKIVSYNRELAQYFNDVMQDILVETKEEKELKEGMTNPLKKGERKNV